MASQRQINKSKRLCQELLDLVDIQINGNRPVDIQVHDERTYERVLKHGSLGLGESYMDGWWDCDDISEFISRMLRNKLDLKVNQNKKLLLRLVAYNLMNFQSKRRAYIVGEKHYDTGNELYERMLDPYLNYSCAYWQDVNNLETAQQKKLDLICRKLQLKPGMRLLDIGCGWGGLVKYAAENYNVEAHGITVSKEQREFAQQRCKGLPATIELNDYRQVNFSDNFDRIVSVGMFEHVGYKNYRTFFEVVHRYLKDDGIFLLHTIGVNTSLKNLDAWFDKYIFPNAQMPSIAQIGKAIENLFVMEDWHNFGPYYDKTVTAWRENFNSHWNELQQQYPGKYDEHFYRMWNFYLAASAGVFRSRHDQLWQIVLTKGLPGVYPRFS